MAYFPYIMNTARDPDAFEAISKAYIELVS